MPYKNKKIQNAYLNEYMKKRYEIRRIKAIEKLGGCCVVCGSTDRLEFDHIDPLTKLKPIAKLSSASDKIFNAELEKCQLLCYDHHLEKTKNERR